MAYDTVMNPLLLNFPEQFESERLIIRAPRPGDGAAMNAGVLESLDQLRPWMPWARVAPSPDESEMLVRRWRAAWLLREDLALLMFRKDGVYIGGSGLHRINWDVPKFEIGYWLRTSMHGNGYMTEAVNAIAAFAFDVLKARRVEIRMDDRNTRSWRVAERCGFAQEALLRNDVLASDGSLRDTRIYARVR